MRIFTPRATFDSEYIVSVRINSGNYYKIGGTVVDYESTLYVDMIHGNPKNEPVDLRSKVLAFDGEDAISVINQLCEAEYWTLDEHGKSLAYMEEAQRRDIEMRAAEPVAA